MKKIILSAATAVLVVVLTNSCKKGGTDEGTSTLLATSTSLAISVSKIENVSEVALDTVKLMAGTYVVSSAVSGINGSFALSVQDDVDAAKLTSSSSFFDAEKFDITSNPSDAKILEVDLIGYKAGQKVCDVYAYSKDAQGHTAVSLSDIVFAVQDVTVTLKLKSETEAQTYDVVLKKGWNMVYQDKRTSDNRKFVTTLPEGVQLKWYYRLP